MKLTYVVLCYKDNEDETVILKLRDLKLNEMKKSANSFLLN
jgi:hypothetical protein